MFAKLVSRLAPSPIVRKSAAAPRLLLGWDAEPASEAIGFTASSPASQEAWRGVTYDGDAPLLTCASTGAGKGRGVLIPNLLTYPGPVIATDVKGELFQVTSRRRREMGQRVVALDPWHLVTAKSDSLNPIDLLSLPRADLESDAEMIASLLAVGNEFSSDPFWDTTAKGLTAGLIAHIANFPAKERHLGQLRAWLYHDDLDMAIAKLLDTNGIKSRMARDLLIAYLAAPYDRTRPCIRTMACSYMNALGSDQVLETLRTSSFRLQDVFDGAPLSIYIVIPPEKLESHKALLRLWIGTLLTTVTRRTTMPEQRTLFLLDECAQLGPLAILRQAITLLRGSGLQAWTIWQDLSQLRQLYPKDWQSIINNSGVLQVFGITNHQMAKEWSELLGQSPEALDRLARDEASVLVQGERIRTCRRPDYLKDKVFAGLFDANPRFALQPANGTSRSYCAK